MLDLRRTLFTVALTACSLLAFQPAATADCGKDHGAEGKEHAKAKSDIVETASADENFETLVKALKSTGLTETLKGKGPYTVFAPTDAAFEALPEGTVENLLKPENEERLRAILTYHVVPAKVPAKAASQRESAETVHGGSLDLHVHDGELMVGSAKVVKSNIMTTNGVIHAIDTVLMPSETRTGR